MYTYCGTMYSTMYEHDQIPRTSMCNKYIHTKVCACIYYIYICVRVRARVYVSPSLSSLFSLPAFPKEPIWFSPYVLYTTCDCYTSTHNTYTMERRIHTYTHNTYHIPRTIYHVLCTFACVCVYTRTTYYELPRTRYHACTHMYEVHSTYGIYCIVQVHMYILQYNYYTYMCEVYPCTVYSLYLEVRSTVYHRVKSYTKYKKTYFC